MVSFGSSSALLFGVGFKGVPAEYITADGLKSLQVALYVRFISLSVIRESTGCWQPTDRLH